MESVGRRQKTLGVVPFLETFGAFSISHCIDHAVIPNSISPWMSLHSRTSKHGRAFKGYDKDDDNRSIIHRACLFLIKVEYGMAVGTITWDIVKTASWSGLKSG
jgi:hypothetical protein